MPSSHAILVYKVALKMLTIRDTVSQGVLL